MQKRTNVPVTIPAAIARTQLGSLLKQISRGKARFLITKGGKPTAVLLGVQDFDDIIEELDPAFQTTLKVAAKEYKAGKAITLQDYMRKNLHRSRAR